MRQTVDYAWQCGAAGALLYHVVGRWPLDWTVGVAAWGVAACWLCLWNATGTGRRAMLDLAVVAAPVALFAATAPALAVLDMVPVTPALLAASMSCARVAVPCVVNGARAVQGLLVRRNH